MKKIAMWILATSAIISLGFNSVYAFGWGQGYGNGQGNWRLAQYVTDAEKAKMQSLSGEERTEYMNQLKEKYGITQNQDQRQGQRKGYWQGQGQQKNVQSQGHWNHWNSHGSSENMADLIKDVPASDLNETEQTLLINQYGEEKMARDLYAYAAEKYPNINTFSNITSSEQKHMDAIKVLLDRYDIEAPSDYAKDNDLFVTLKNKIDQSEKDAIEVGITVEMVDIDNIAADIKATDNDDLKIILTNIGGASYNHLRGFVNALQNAGYETDLEWTNYISEDDLNTRGPLKVKLAEKLEAEGVDLPEKASSDYIKNNCNEDDTKGWNHGQGQNQNRGYGKGNVNKAQTQAQNRITNVSTQAQKYVDNTKVEKYKNLLNIKYSKVLDKLDEEKLRTILPKIDTLIDKIVTSTKYTETKKETYVNLLIAFKEVIEEKLSDIDNNLIDWLL